MKTMAVEQNCIGMTGNTSVTEVKVNGKTKFVLTNNKVFNRFNFVQEYFDKDTAWDRAEVISRFERDFINALFCWVNKDCEIALRVIGKQDLQIYQIFRGELIWKTTVDFNKTHKTFGLPEKAIECINYINSKIKPVSVNTFSSIEEIIETHKNSIIYAANRGCGYNNIFVADITWHEVYTTYSLTEDNKWIQSNENEIEAIGETLSWCIKHLDYGFPMWRKLYEPVQK